MIGHDERPPAGNVYPKYTTRNPVERFLVQRFLTTLEELVEIAHPNDIHEVGCGEGELTCRLKTHCPNQVRGSDLSTTILDRARRNHPSIPFSTRDVLELTEEDSADLIVCAEVLEHIHQPHKALQALARVTRKYCLLTVPLEPIWRALNMARGRYWTAFGNTPGHLHHWSRTAFLRTIDRHSRLVVRSPLPWTVGVLGSCFGGAQRPWKLRDPRLSK